MSDSYNQQSQYGGYQGQPQGQGYGHEQNNQQIYGQQAAPYGQQSNQSGQEGYQHQQQYGQQQQQ